MWHIFYACFFFLLADTLHISKRKFLETRRERERIMASKLIKGMIRVITLRSILFMFCA